MLKISATVGMQYSEITENVKAVLLEGFHSGTLNTDGKALNDFCQKAKAMNIPVFLTKSEFDKAFLPCAEDFYDND